MNMRKISAVIAASLAVCTVCTSCGGKKKQKSSEGKKSNDSSVAGGETAVAAKSGQAYLEIRDASGLNQYLGSNEENLCYNAGVADITKNGSYTVSVTADSDGFRANAGGSEGKPKGIMYAALRLNDGESTCPGAVMTIDSIKVDGSEIPMISKNYTFTESGKDIKSNIYNEWASKIMDDAISAEGRVIEGTPGYSSVIVDKEYFESWTTVEVNFTVTGIDT